MIHAAFRDLLWRRRRYLISMIGCGLVFGMSLLMSGLAAAFGLELDRTMEHLGAREFVMPEGVSGPFSGAKPFPEADLPAGTIPMAYVVQSARGSGHRSGVSVFGVPPGSAAEPKAIEGHGIEGDNQVLVNDGAPFEVGSVVEFAGTDHTVVGKVEDLSLNAGTPGLVMGLPEMQAQLFGGAPLVTAGVVTGESPELPDGFQLVSAAEARDDALRLLGAAIRSVYFITALLWGVAALIIASVVYLSAIERTRDFAVFKATGTSTKAMAAGLALQAVTVALAAGVVGVGMGLLLAPTYPLPVTVSWSSVGLLLAVAVVVGLVASLFGLRRAVSVEPALAFGGAA
jgi:putative ABC transport system permease protein